LSAFFLLSSLGAPESPNGLLAQDATATPQVSQDATATPQVAQEEGSQYARVRFLEGDVAIVPSEAAASPDQFGVNTPILPGDQLQTRDGRAEVQFADGGVLRLDRRTQVEAAALPDLTNKLENRTLLKLSSGSIFLHLLPLNSTDEQVRVDTPTASIYLLSAGIFRIDVAPDGGRVFLSSHTGVAEIVAEGISVLVRSGERSDARPGGSPSNPRPFNGFSGDDFDRWTHDRQGAYVNSNETVPVAEVPAEVTPYVSELSSYGNWVHDDNYGWAWAPQVAADWTPYQSGYWYGAPSGWVWVSYDPWGWAPYHYGRWDYSGYGWVWIPGSVFAGAWVSWAYYPGYYGWCPLNYYNYPVGYGYGYGYGYDHHHGTGGSAHHPWTFVPQSQVANPQLQRAAISKVQLERMASGSVPMSQPPAATPRAAAQMKQPQVAARNTTPTTPPKPDGELVSFRTLEGRGHARTEPVRAGVVTRGASSPAGATFGRTQSVAARNPGLALTPPPVAGAAPSPTGTPVNGTVSRRATSSVSPPSSTARPGAPVAAAPRSTAVTPHRATPPPRGSTGSPSGTAVTPRSATPPPRGTAAAPRSATGAPSKAVAPQATRPGTAPPATSAPSMHRNVPLTARQPVRVAPGSQPVHAEPRSPILDRLFAPQGAPPRTGATAPPAGSARPSSGAVQPSAPRPQSAAPSRGSAPSRGGAATPRSSGSSGGHSGGGSRGSARKSG
jgi:hypothetical protein